MCIRDRLVTARRGGQVILVVIHLIAAIPVLVLDGSAFLPFLMLDVGVAVSYTHLDVYKRQAQSEVRRRQPRRRDAGQTRP